MGSEDGRYTVVFNGQIYNHVELREELIRSGCRFRSRSDTEVLLAAFQRWGAECLPRLLGMFAFAVVDSERGSVFLARDHLGIKPLYYTFPTGGFAFASQVSALLEISGLPAIANSARLQQFLLGGAFDHGQASFFKGVEQVKPGHWMEVNMSEPQPVVQAPYWKVPSGETAKITFPDAVERTRELLSESVRLHLRSDVPVASALSGGMDSSSIVALMRKAQQPGTPLHTFTFVTRGQAGFDPSWDEEGWAEIVGHATGAEMHKVRVDPRRLPEDFQRFTRLQDGPFSSPVIWVQQQVFRAAHEAGFRVMMSGQGSDELMAGYRRHISARLASLLRQGRIAEYVRLLRCANLQPNDEGTAPLLSDSLRASLPRSWRTMGRRVRTREFPRWARTENWRSLLDDQSDPPYGRHLLKAALRHDLEIAPIPALLRYEDRNSMSHSVEDRLPFLNPRLVEFVFSLPEEFLVSPDAVNKRLLREAMRGLVPDAVLNRRDRMGFPVPAAFWLLELQDWISQVLATAGDVPLFDGDEIQRRWRSFRDQGGRPAGDAYLLWRWVFVLGWAQSFGVNFEAN